LAVRWTFSAKSKISFVGLIGFTYRANATTRRPLAMYSMNYVPHGLEPWERKIHELCTEAKKSPETLAALEQHSRRQQFIPSWVTGFLFNEPRQLEFCRKQPFFAVD